MSDSFKWDREKHEQSVKDMQETHTDLGCPKCGNPTFTMLILFEQVASNNVARRSVKAQLPRCTRCGEITEPMSMKLITLKAV